MADKPKYDVAISFLAADEPTARALADQLGSSGLSVFFFPRNQEELAGTDGMESMREPFLSARVAVVRIASSGAVLLGHASRKQRSRTAA
jgi:hypothetical protein